MAPDPEEVLRKKVRHLRRAHHETTLARDLGGYFHDEIERVSESVDEVVQMAIEELTRIRDKE